jgi:small subunit ribosomal protein S2
MTHVTNAIAEGLAERKSEKQADNEGEETKAPKAKKSAAKTMEVAEEEETTAPKVAKKEKEAPKKEAPAKAEKAAADDLTKVEGIGPKISEIFQTSGIKSFADLAGKSEDDLKEILAAAGSRYASKNPASWPKQAKMAAEGKWDELKEWQDNAKGGIEE